MLVFEFNGKSVTLRTFSGIKIDVNGVAVDFAVLHTDIEDEPSYITLNDIRMVVIQRGNRMGVRMWDNQVESRRTFPARTWFAIDESFNLPSQYTRYDRPKTVFFPDLTGEKTESTVDGYITFKYSGKDYKLDISEEDGQLFLRFKDPTSESESYPTGRYIYLDYDAKSGKFMLDFNLAYSPPCAFTDFATCVFAPDQNFLDFRVTAGETFKQIK